MHCSARHSRWFTAFHSTHHLGRSFCLLSDRRRHDCCSGGAYDVQTCGCETHGCAGNQESFVRAMGHIIDEEMIFLRNSTTRMVTALRPRSCSHRQHPRGQRRVQIAPMDEEELRTATGSSARTVGSSIKAPPSSCCANDIIGRR